MPAGEQNEFCEADPEPGRPPWQQQRRSEGRRQQPRSDNAERDGEREDGRAAQAGCSWQLVRQPERGHGDPEQMHVAREDGGRSGVRPATETHRRRGPGRRTSPMADVHAAGARHHRWVHVSRSTYSCAPIASHGDADRQQQAPPRRGSWCQRCGQDQPGCRRAERDGGQSRQAPVRKPIGRASTATAQATTAIGRASCPGEMVLQSERVAARPITTAMARVAGTSIASSVARVQMPVASRTSAEPSGTSGARVTWALSRSSAQVAGESARTCANHGVPASGHAAGLMRVEQPEPGKQQDRQQCEWPARGDARRWGAGQRTPRDPWV